MPWFWQEKKPAPAPVPQKEPECVHIWDKWSKPFKSPIKITSYGYSASATEREGLIQDRYCLRCNMVERRTA